jgi:hypothetical protein
MGNLWTAFVHPQKRNQKNLSYDSYQNPHSQSQSLSQRVCFLGQFEGIQFLKT